MNREKLSLFERSINWLRTYINNNQLLTNLIQVFMVIIKVSLISESLIKGFYKKLIGLFNDSNQEESLINYIVFKQLSEINNQ